MPANWFSLGRLFDFRGRASRREYFVFHLICFGGILLPILVLALFAPSTQTVVVDEPTRPSIPLMLFGTLYMIVQLSMIVGLFAVAVRRLHDQGKSWWHMLFGIVPVIGWIINLVWIFTPGDEGENEYGPDPRDRTIQGTSYEGVFD
jgi:uncharacterized membrane protein YhaH (DUF805 family)